MAPPTTGECGFSDCDGAKRVGSQAPCEGDAYTTAVTNEIDGGIDWVEVGCNGDYLVLDLGHRSCASNGRSCVSSIGRAFFVAENGDWRLITYCKKFTCKWVRTSLNEPDLSDSLCSKSPPDTH